jgi:LPXTG-motif cell wall-anchored protein
MAVRITRSGVGLTVGIIVLALVVLGGLYFVRERGEQARREDAIEVAQENLESQSERESALNPSDENGDEATDDGSTADDGDQTQEMPVGGTGQGGPAAPQELPATGPTETAAMVIIGLLSFATASYVMSRRALTRR